VFGSCESCVGVLAGLLGSVGRNSSWSCLERWAWSECWGTLALGVLRARIKKKVNSPLLFSLFVGFVLC
jgi:hypothetical protein